MSNKYSDRYDFGYRKPPMHSRFKPGQSGNRKGRPKGRKNVWTALQDVLNQTVTINENGRLRRVKFAEALVLRLAAKALTGTTRDQIAIFKMIHGYAPELLREPEGRKRIEIVFVKAKDGKPAPDDEDEDPDDWSFLN